MNLSIYSSIKLFEELRRIDAVLPLEMNSDSLAKSFLIAHLVRQYALSNYVEIGAKDIGRSFLAAVHTTATSNGKAYRIHTDDGKRVDKLADSIQLTRQHESVKPLPNAPLIANSEFLPEASADKYLSQNEIGIDLLHIKGEHEDHGTVARVLALVKDNGFIVFDDTSVNLIKAVLKRLKRNYQIVFSNDIFTIMQIEGSNAISMLETSRLNLLYSMAENVEKHQTPDVDNSPDQRLITISVIIISYNQEKYINECLQGIFAQKGEFQIELIISDDGSQDATGAVIESFVKAFSNTRISVKNISSQVNVGMTKNFQRALYACTGDYIAICEGDDFWIDCFKLQKQLEFLRSHPECSLCFNSIYLYFQDSNELTIFEPYSKLSGDMFSTKDLITEYFIGNLSCCMYNAQYLKQIPINLFDLFIGDWMFNIFYSRFGMIGRIEEAMSVYRKHADGVWASMTPDKAKFLYNQINAYNRFLNYEFDQEFSTYQQRIIQAHPDAFRDTVLDIAIIDDIAPHPLSAFRAQEFASYLGYFDNIKIYCSGLSIHFFGKKELKELLIDFKKKNPEYAEKIEIIKPNTPINAKVIYTVFLGNTYLNIDRIEQLRIPFVFTLYPGGFFGLNNERSDLMLKRVTSSPYFRKVIVTQKVTYDYLIDKKFCTPDQIKFIFGVVTPLEQLEAHYKAKQHYGIDKQTLDICFVAHKYTERGIDKGYDIFIDVAKKLSQKYENIHFHVVGGFGESEIDVGHLNHRIKFYGGQEMEWFDEFYKDKDIILSPNVPFKIFSGSFDGFPTGSCTDAGLRETAMFCTDELNLNSGFFVDGEEIVIIPHNADKIVEIVVSYYHDPQRLMSIAKNGREKIKKLYSYEAQLLPRIKLLKEQVDLFESNKKIIENKLKQKIPFARRFVSLAIKVIEKAKRNSPKWLKDLAKGLISRLRSNETLLGFLRNHSPAIIKRLYNLIFG